MWPEAVTLEGTYVRLEPLSHERHDELVDAVRDGELWRLWYTKVPSPEGMHAEIDWRRAQQARGSMLPFAIVARENGRAVGMTTYCNVVPEHRRVEIGYTWYRASAQRTALNTECKLLLLTHAFEALDCIAVEFRTHIFNTQRRQRLISSVSRRSLINPVNSTASLTPREPASACNRSRSSP
jgi:RimJ/RimL family protein N-acetyltransferase